MTEIKLYVTRPDGSWTGEIITDYKVRSRAGTLPFGVLTANEPPSLEAGKTLFVSGKGIWSQIERPEVAHIESYPTRISQSAFMSLFTDEEVVKWDVLKRDAQNAGLAGTEYQRGLIAVAARLAPLGLVDLAHPKTIAGMELLANSALEIITPARLEEIRIGKPPTET